jgi:DNA uptake protein ComE-like DNA-binding protein
MNISQSIRLLAGICVGLGLTFSAPAAEQRQKSAPSAPSAGGTAAPLLDINTADVRALEAVPVIGPDAARAIVAGRPFATIDELDRIKGISAERLEQIRAVVTVGSSHTPTKLGSPTVDTPTAPASGDSAKKKIDLNTANLKTLENTPEIGPELAREIVAARPFASVDELNRVKGMSAERLEHIRAKVVVAPVRETRKIPAP